jgi:hypothetical protein
VARRGNAEFAGTFLVSDNYFPVLGVAPERGRAFTADSARNPATSLSVNAQPFTIIGITPHDFAGASLAAPDFWMPLSLEPLVHPDSDPLHDRENLHFRLHGGWRNA